MKRPTAVALLLLACCGCSTRPATPAGPAPTAGPGAKPAGVPVSAVLPPPAEPAAPPAVHAPALPPPGKPCQPYAIRKSLAEVSNYGAFTKVFKLRPEQETMLKKNLFACTPTSYNQLFFVYENNQYHQLPSFVSVDVVLHLYHVFFDYTLRKSEEGPLYDAAAKLARTMAARSLRTYNEQPGPALKDAALRNCAYFGVAAQALGERVKLPPEAAAMVKAEMAAIERHEGFVRSAIFPYKLDFSQFVPRGHYTRSPRLKRYFTAIMWFGLAPFATRMAGEACTPTITQGLLMTRDLKRAGAMPEWQRIYDPTTFYVGKADDLTPAEWQGVSETVFGATPKPDAFADKAKQGAFLARVEKLRAARIQAKMVLEKEVPDPAVQLRFMGQRYIPDSEILTRVAAPVQRPFPSGLDVLAVLGSDRAAAILDANPKLYNANNWPDYLVERAKANRDFAAIKPATWTSNLYWGWLDCLRPLIASVPKGYPSFMTGPAWSDCRINTALGSWAELRHDTILYGKQTTVECGGGPETIPTGYIEPNIPFYTRMAALIRSQREGLQQRKLLPDRVKDKLVEFENLVNFLKACSVKELDGRKLTEEEYTQIHYIGGQVEHFVLSTIDNNPGYWDLVSEQDRDMAEIADVVTASPKVLEVGVGRAYEILVIVPIGGKMVLTRGAALSYHEFTHPISDRLTDEKWRAMLKAGKAPAAPEWTRSFVVPGARPSKKQEQLEGYTSGC